MELLGTVASIWRYPIKSLHFEALGEAELTLEGLPGDRAAALFVQAGHARAGNTYRGKEHNRLHLTGAAEDALAMAAERGVRVELKAEPAKRYFDAAPVSVLLDRWVGEVEKHLGYCLDPLRWRPNFYVRTEPGTASSEADLCGREITIGTAVLRVRSGIKRCVTPTYDVTDGTSEPEILDYVARRRDNVMGIYCDVVRAGFVREGDALRL